MPNARDEEIYQLARKLVGAEIQKITYQEFLPLLLGPMAPDPRNYRFDPNIDTRIANEFSTVAYRFGHSMVSPELKLHHNNGPQGTILLRDAFFKPNELVTNPGLLSRLIGGLIQTEARRLDNMIVDDIRSFLFGDAGDGGFDLGALNIQRGRDHGIPKYNALRQAYGLPRFRSFDQVSSNPVVQTRLAAMYANVDEIDAWVGGLAEDVVQGALVGELMGIIMSEQFERLMNGDPFFYRGDDDLRNPDVEAIMDIRDFKLAKLIADNTNLNVDPVFDVLKMPGRVF